MAHYQGVILALLLLVTKVYCQNDPRCNSTTECPKPDCYCPSTIIPGGFDADSVPQMILFTFEGQMTSEHAEYIKQLFSKRRRNPNGTPIRATFFLSDDREKTDYCTVNGLWAFGHEFASFSVNRRGPPEFWASASLEQWSDEIDFQKAYIAGNASIPENQIIGFRSPYLQISNTQYEFAIESAYVYDSSIVLPVLTPRVWPFTMDFPINSSQLSCGEDPCPDVKFPTGEYNGLWQVPIQPLKNLQGGSCTYLRKCVKRMTNNENYADDVYKILKTNFDENYLSNKAPLVINIQDYLSWFNEKPLAVDGINRFIDELLSMPVDDIWFVTYRDMIGWMQQPTQLFHIRYFGPFDRTRQEAETCEERLSFTAINGQALLIVEIIACAVAFIYFYIKENVV